MAGPPHKQTEQTHIGPVSGGGDEGKVVIDDPSLWSDSTQKRTTDPRLPVDSLTGLTLGEYEVHEELGAGGMGIVYRGIQPMIGKAVAIKVLRPEVAADTTFVAELLAEARAVNAIRHPGIVDIFSFGTTPDGRQYIVMELLDGQPIDVMISERGRLLVSETLDIIEQVLSALAAAHRAGVIHRDLKPGNILVTKLADGSIRTKILDFGLAKQAPKGESSVAQTHAHVVRGTPAYMSPEQARGLAVSAQTDLYAIGVILFEMVTGKLPFSAPSLVELLMEQINKPPPAPSSFEAVVPDSLDELVLWLLSKRTEDRPTSADEVRQAVIRIKRELQSQATQVKGMPMPSRPRLPQVEPQRQAPSVPASNIKVATEVAVPAIMDAVPALARPSRLPLIAGGVIGGALLLGLGIWATRPKDVVPVDPPPTPVKELPLIEVPTKVEPPKVDPPKVDPPKVDPPKVDPPKVDPPKVDPPKVDPPKVDPPKVDPPKPPKGDGKTVKTDPKPPVSKLTKSGLEQRIDKALKLAGDRQDQAARQARGQLDELKPALNKGGVSLDEIDAVLRAAEASLKQ